MSLVDLQRAVLRVCTATEPDAEDLRQLGDRKRFLLYREMVRDRLFDIVGKALPRTKEALGADLAKLGASWLAEAPPTTPYFREVVEQFCDHAIPRLAGDASRPPWLADLVTFERAVWEVGYAAQANDVPVVDFEFEKPMALSTTHRRIVLSHGVHEAAPYAPGAIRLVVYRRRDVPVAAWRSVNDVTAALFDEWAKGDGGANEAVRKVAAARGIGIDQRFLEGLGGVVADFLEAGVILGSRASR